jgi:hypothetical protein
MDAFSEILLALGRIEGELIEIRRLSERVRMLEVWHPGSRAGGPRWLRRICTSAGWPGESEHEINAKDKHE